jgi:hypothetical protein
MQRKPTNKGDIYYAVTEDNREWVNPGEIPVFRKLFAEFDAVNQRLNRLEQSLIQFANAHKLQHNNDLESVIGALCHEVQVIKSGHPYLAVQLEQDVIRDISKPDVLITEQPMPEWVVGTYYTVRNGKIVENEQIKNEMGVLL